MGVTIGNLRFSSQSAASRHFKAIRDKYSLGDTVFRHDAEALFNLLDHHAASGAPSRQETKEFIVDASKWGKTSPCFYAVTVRGSRFALSTSSSAAYQRTPAGAAKLAFRLLGKNETKLARNRLPHIVKCGHCATPIASSDAEMDHYPERFEELLARFLSSKGLAIADVKTISDGQGSVAIEGSELKTAWMAFHRAEAEFVPSCRGCNREG